MSLDTYTNLKQEIIDWSHPGDIDLKVDRFIKMAEQDMFANPDEVIMHDQLVELVETMLALHKHLPEAKTDHEKTSIQRQIDATDGQIDKLVYTLYGLTDDEIAIVEGEE